MRFAGIDIDAEKHFVAVVDDRREVLVKSTAFTEDAAGYGKLLELHSRSGSRRTAAAWSATSSSAAAASCGSRAARSSWRRSGWSWKVSGRESPG